MWVIESLEREVTLQCHPSLNCSSDSIISMCCVVVETHLHGEVCPCQHNTDESAGQKQYVGELHDHSSLTATSNIVTFKLT